MGMAGVVMIDRDPIQPGSEVLLHLVHETSSEAPQAPQLRAVLGRNDEPELVAVLPAAPSKRLAVGAIQDRRIDTAGLSVAGDPIALQIAKVGVGLIRDPQVSSGCARCGNVVANAARLAMSVKQDDGHDARGGIDA
jgi:hypothetical protein